MEQILKQTLTPIENPQKIAFAIFLSTTCVKAFAFQSPNIGPFEAQYKRQSLLYEI